MNVCFFNKNFDDLDHLFQFINKAFDIIAICQTRNYKTNLFTTNMDMKNYSCKFTTTESSSGRIVLYIARHLSYKPRPDLNIYKANQ